MESNAQKLFKLLLQVTTEIVNLQHKFQDFLFIQACSDMKFDFNDFKIYHATVINSFEEIIELVDNYWFNPDLTPGLLPQLDKAYTNLEVVINGLKSLDTKLYPEIERSFNEIYERFQGLKKRTENYNTRAAEDSSRFFRFLVSKENLTDRYNYKIVEDGNILKNFLKIITKDLTPTQSIFVNSCFRSKKLTETERSSLGARSREIYLTKNLRLDKENKVDLERLVNKYYELEVPIRALTYQQGDKRVSLPQHALLCYTCPNPSNEVDVSIEHMTSTLEIVKSYIHSNTKFDVEKQLSHHNKDFRSERTRFVEKKWIDFDIDINFESDQLDTVKDLIKQTIHHAEQLQNITGLLVRTSGGFHVLISKKSLRGNPYDIVKLLTTTLQTIVTEDNVVVEYKKGGFFVPTPGTIQYGRHLVTFEEL